jgi:hypothetical protein
MGKGRGVYKFWVWKSEGKKPLGRPRSRGEDNIKMDIQEVGFVGMDWIELAQDRGSWQALVTAVMNLGVWGKGEAYTEIWWGNLRERDNWRDPGLNGRVILIWILGK